MAAAWALGGLAIRRDGGERAQNSMGGTVPHLAHPDMYGLTHLDRFIILIPLPLPPATPITLTLFRDTAASTPQRHSRYGLTPSNRLFAAVLSMQDATEYVPGTRNSKGW